MTRPARRCAALPSFFAAAAALMLLVSAAAAPPLVAAQAADSPAASALASEIAALQTDAGRAYLATLSPETVDSLAAGVAQMSPERRQALARMDLPAVERVFAAANEATAAAAAAAAAPAAAAPATPPPPPSPPAAPTIGKGRAAALATLASKGWANDDGALDEPSLAALKALASLPEPRLREMAALPSSERAAALGHFADGVSACSCGGRMAAKRARRAF
jgi:hypothetical protein